MNRNSMQAIAIAGAAAVVTTVLAGCGSSSDNGSAGNSGGSSGSNSDGASATTAACTPKWKFDTINAGTLTVAAPDQPPYFFDKDGKASGLDGDILVRFAADACLKTNFVKVASSAAIQSAITKRVDVVAGGWDATPERGGSVGQTDPTYADLPAIDSTSGLSKMSDLKGKTVGTVTGYYWVPELQKYLGNSHVKTYPGNANVLKDLEAGRLDAAVLSTVEAGYAISQDSQYGNIKNELIQNDPDVEFTHSGYASNFPHIKGNQALTDALNAEIKEMKSSGWFGDLMKQYGLPTALGEVQRPSWQK